MKRPLTGCADTPLLHRHLHSFSKAQHTAGLQTQQRGGLGGELFLVDHPFPRGGVQEVKAGEVPLEGPQGVEVGEDRPGEPVGGEDAALPPRANLQQVTIMPTGQAA
jgi:hypothetical protein